ncbi:hypothetical protein KIPB_012238, partial [Kipferlia bialata]|eukprot:g12238.t1
MAPDLPRQGANPPAPFLPVSLPFPGPEPGGYPMPQFPSFPFQGASGASIPDFSAMVGNPVMPKQEGMQSGGVGYMGREGGLGDFPRQMRMPVGGQMPGSSGQMAVSGQGMTQVQPQTHAPRPIRQQSVVASVVPVQ